jgi:hypothetical protein
MNPIPGIHDNLNADPSRTKPSDSNQAANLDGIHSLLVEKVNHHLMPLAQKKWHQLPRKRFSNVDRVDCTIETKARKAWQQSNLHFEKTVAIGMLATKARNRSKCKNQVAARRHLWIP